MAYSPHYYLLPSAFLPIFVFSKTVVESAGNEIRSKAVPFWKALPSQRYLTVRFPEFPGYVGISSIYQRLTTNLVLAGMPPSTKQTYTKLAKSLDEQVSLLRSRGVVICKEQKAKDYLSDIGYYRLGFYSFPFEITYPELGSRRRHDVQPGTQIEDIVALYYYDLDLRTLLNRYLSRIEVSIRTTITYALSIKYRLDHTWFISPAVMTQPFIKSFNKEVYSHIRNKPTIVRHHRKYYGKYAPAWKTIEFMTMGNMEELYDNLLLDADKRLISKKYNEPAIGAFKSYMSVLREVRNACAHGNVLYDLHLVSGVIIGAACPSFAPGTQQTLSGALRVIDFMLRQISTNRAKDMWNELFRATERLYSKVPSIRPLIEQKTGIFVPKKKSLGKDIGRFLTKLFGK